MDFWSPAYPFATVRQHLDRAGITMTLRAFVRAYGRHPDLKEWLTTVMSALKNSEFVHRPHGRRLMNKIWVWCESMLVDPDRGDQNLHLPKRLSYYVGLTTPRANRKQRRRQVKQMRAKTHLLREVVGDILSTCLSLYIIKKYNVTGFCQPAIRLRPAAREAFLDFQELILTNRGVPAGQTRPEN